MIYANPTEQPRKKLIVNITGEPYQPARLYYTIHKKKTVVRALQKLRCIQYDPECDSWDWYYEAEAKKIRFKNSYNKIPKEKRPVLIGAFFFRSDTEMILELNSAYHVPIAIEFFDTRINRRAAEVTKMRLVNRFYSTEDDEEQATNRKYTLDSDRVALPDDGDLEQILESCEDEDKRFEVFNDYLDERAKQPLPEIQEIPIYYYEEGIENLYMTIKFHNIEAFQRWQGNPITQFDIIQKIEEAEQENLFSELLKNASEEEIEQLKQIIAEEIEETEEETIEVEGVTVTEESES